MKKRFLPLIFAFLAISSAASAAIAQEITLGVLPFGTLGWEVAVIQSEGLDRDQGFTLKPHSVASSQAGKIALQAGAVDMIVSDWIWVTRQRAAGADFTFAPYSSSSGALIVPKDSPIGTLENLKGKRVGIAGGGLDKNWILLRGLARKQFGFDPEGTVKTQFGAPPLLNQQMLQGNLDALMNFWHYAAQLEAKGYRRLLDGNEILKGLGIEQKVPALGFVFREAWAENNRPLVEGFLRASRQAKDRLCESDQAWNDILPLTRTDNPEVQVTLRKRYCEGRVDHWGDEEKQAAGKIFTLLHQLGGKPLTGKATTLQTGTFWSYGDL